VKAVGLEVVAPVLSTGVGVVEDRDHLAELLPSIAIRLPNSNVALALFASTGREELRWGCSVGDELTYNLGRRKASAAGGGEGPVSRLEAHIRTALQQRLLRVTLCIVPKIETRNSGENLPRTASAEDTMRKYAAFAGMAVRTWWYAFVGAVLILWIPLVVWALILGAMAEETGGSPSDRTAYIVVTVLLTIGSFFYYRWLIRCARSIDSW